MKYIYILFLTLPLLFSSCLFDDKDVFDESASQRVDTSIKQIREVLAGSKNGWLMKFYPHKKQIYGGYTLFTKYSEGSKVVVASEIGNVDQTIESMYDVIGDSGPVLTFNSYNDFIHFFSDPQNQLGIGPADSGMGGDYEFMVLEATPERIALLGKKTRNTIYMTPLPDGEWKELLEKYKDANKIYSKFVRYTYKVNEITADVTQQYRTLTFTYPGDNGATDRFTVGYRCTPTGYEFYEPITIGGVEVSEMAYVSENGTDAFTDVGNSGAKLTVVSTPLNAQLVNNNWYFKASAMSPYTLTQWKLVQTALASVDEKLHRGWLGSVKGDYGFCFQSTDGKEINAGIMIYTYRLIGDDQIEFTCKMVGDSNGVLYHNKGKLFYIMGTIAYGPNATKIFTLTGNDPKNPTTITLKDDNNADNFFTVSREVVDWPFDK